MAGNQSVGVESQTAEVGGAFAYGGAKKFDVFPSQYFASPAPFNPYIPHPLFHPRR